MSVNDRQRSVLAGFAANLAVVFVGYGMTDQPLATFPMTWKLRGSMMILSLGALILAAWIERRGRSHR